MFGTTDVEQQQQRQQGQGFPDMSREGLSMSKAVRQLAASPALWAAAWAQLAAFCQAMYTRQYGKLAKAKPSSSSSTTTTNRNSSSRSSSRSKSSRSGSSIAGSSDLAGMFASLQLSSPHEQVAAVFDPEEISARIEDLEFPGKSRHPSEAAVASSIGNGIRPPGGFLLKVFRISMLHDWPVFCEGLGPQQGSSGDYGSRPRESYASGGGSSSGSGNSSSGGSSSSGGGSSNDAGNSRGGGCSSSGGNIIGSSDSRGQGNSGSNSNGGSSTAITGALEVTSRAFTGSSSRGSVAPAAALQLVLEAAVLLGVADRPQESSAAVTLPSVYNGHPLQLGS